MDNNIEILEEDKKSINKIYHISDIHISKYDRHNEFRNVFNNLFKLINNDVKKEDSLIVITGDILDRGMDLSPECIELLQDLYISLTNICDVITINGNHDYKGASVNYTNPLYPFVEKIFYNKSGKKSYILDKNKNYIYNNIIFGVTTCFSTKVTECKLATDKIKIGLYHGQFYKSKTNSGYEFDDESLFNCESFIDYDYVLLGDIHKFQYLNKEKTIAYAGSLLQLKRDESILDHGYIRWDLKKKTSKFVRVPNDKVKLEIEYDKDYNIDDIICYKDIDLKINHKSGIKNEEINKFIDKIKSKLKEDSNLTFTNIVDYSDAKINLDVDIEGEKVSLLKLKNDNDVISLFSNYAKIQCKYDDDLVKKINNVLKKSLEELNFKYHNKIKKIKIESLKFNNVFIYGKGNIVNFKKFEGIIGLNSPNYSGKSSLIDTLLFSIFGEHTRGDNDRRSALKVGKLDLTTEIILQVNESLFKICRSYKRKGITSKGGRDTGTYVVEIYKDNELVEKIDKMDEYKRIKEYVTTNICTINDFLLHSIILQKNSNDFVSLKNSSRNNERKDFLLKMVKLDLFNQLQTKVTKIKNQGTAEIRGTNTVLEKMDNNIKDKSIQNLKTIKKEYEDKSTELKLKINEFSENIILLKKNYEIENDEYIKSKLLQNEINNKIKYLIHIFKLNDLIINNENNLNILKSKKQNLKIIDLKIRQKKEEEVVVENNDLINLQNIYKMLNNVSNTNIEKINLKLDENLNNMKIVKNKLNEKNNYLNFLNNSKKIIKNYNKISKKYKILESLREKNINNEKLKFNIEKEINRIKLDLDNYKDHKFNKNCQDCMSNSITIFKINLIQILKNKEIELSKIEKKIKNLNSKIEKKISYDNKYIKLQENIKYNDKIKKDIEYCNNEIIRLELEYSSLNKEYLLNKSIRKEILNNIKLKNNNDIHEKMINISKIENLERSLDNNCNYNLNKMIIIKNNFIDLVIRNIKMKEINLNSKIDKIEYMIDLIIKEKLIYESKIENIQTIKLNNIKLNELKNSLLKKKNEIEQLNINLDKIKLEDHELDTKVKNINICIEEKERIDNQNEVCDKIINMFKCTDGKDGIIDYIITTDLLPKLQEIINNVIKSIDGHMKIQLLNMNGQIYVYTNKSSENNNLIDASSSSGYESDLLNLIFRLAFNKINNFIDFNFLIIDEGLKFSDNKNKGVIKKLIEHMKESYKWIIMISHDDFIKTFYEKDLSIKKISNDESNINYI